MPNFGGYPVADVLAAGDEVSSGYEGRHVTLVESELVHPTHADGFVDKGDPVVIVGGPGVGTALGSAIAATDLIAVDTEGMYGHTVVAVDGSGNSAVAGGDKLFINLTTAVINKINDPHTTTPFGIAYGAITAGSTAVIAVKVHYDPMNQCELVRAEEMTFVEEGAGVYTGSINVPAGSTILDVIVHAVALWDAATSAALIVGDAADPNGFFDAVNLKATNLLAGESISFAQTGGLEGDDLDSPAAGAHVRRRYLATARVVTGQVTSVGAGTAGRTRITVVYSKPCTVGVATFVAA